MTEKIILFGSPGCPMVAPVRRVLKGAKADFEYVDIQTDAQARAQVRQINSGLESVPTLVFPDGSTLAEPSMPEFRAALRGLGYDITPSKTFQQLQSLIESPSTSLLGFLFLAIGAIIKASFLIVVGVGILTIRFVLSWF